MKYAVKMPLNLLFTSGSCTQVKNIRKKLNKFFTTRMTFSDLTF
jgi:hypothetical protein